MISLRNIYRGRFRFLLLHVLAHMILFGLALFIVIWFVNQAMSILSSDNLGGAQDLVVHVGTVSVLGFVVLLLFGDSALVTIMRWKLLSVKYANKIDHSSDYSKNSHYSDKNKSYLNSDKNMRYLKLYLFQIIYVAVVLVLFVGIFWFFGWSNSNWMSLEADADSSILFVPIMFWLILLFLMLWLSVGFDVQRIRKVRFWVVYLVSFLLVGAVLTSLVYLHLFLFDMGFVLLSLGVVLFGIIWFVLVRWGYLYLSYHGEDK